MPGAPASCCAATCRARSTRRAGAASTPAARTPSTAAATRNRFSTRSAASISRPATSTAPAAGAGRVTGLPGALHDRVAIATYSGSLVLPHCLRRTGIPFVGQCSSDQDQRTIRAARPDPAGAHHRSVAEPRRHRRRRLRQRPRLGLRPRPAGGGGDGGPGDERGDRHPASSTCTPTSIGAAPRWASMPTRSAGCRASPPRSIPAAPGPATSQGSASTSSSARKPASSPICTSRSRASTASPRPSWSARARTCA